MNRVELKTVAVANHGGAMEADTIHKNGDSPKTHSSRANFLTMTCFALMSASIIFSGCDKDDDKNGDDDGHTLNFYTFCYDDEKNELVQIDIDNGKLIWTGIKIPNYAYNSRGYVFDESRNEFITFGLDDKPVINRVNLSTKNVITKEISNAGTNSNFDNIIKIKGKFYSFEYSSDKLELAEIDIENGTVSWTGMKIPDYGWNSRGYVFDESRNEFITFGYGDEPVINRVNFSTKNVVTKEISNAGISSNFDNIIKIKDKFYSFEYSSDKLELAEIDIENGTVSWTGMKIPDYAYNSRGYVFDESRNEFITLGLEYDGHHENLVINRLNLSTKNVITKTINNPDGNNFAEIISW